MLNKFLQILFFLDADPKNYIAYFRRAAVYLGMGKSKAALPDLSKVIELKPDFIAVSLFHV
jgi:DnaJ family protein C protein 3